MPCDFCEGIDLISGAFWAREEEQIPMSATKRFTQGDGLLFRDFYNG